MYSQRPHACLGLGFLYRKGFIQGKVLAVESICSKKGCSHVGPVARKVHVRPANQHSGESTGVSFASASHACSCVRNCRLMFVTAISHPVMA
jgi:hypothetical protein